MSVTSQVPRNVSTAAPGATAFPYDFKVLSKFDLLVQVDGIAKVVDTDFTVTGVGLDAGGDITFLAPMSGGEKVMRRRNMAFERATDYQSLGDLRSPTLNNDQDAPVMMLQQLAESDARSVKLPADSTASGQLEEIQPLMPLIGNVDGTGFQFGDTTLTGDMALRPALADPSTPGYGASLVAFKQAGIGAFGRTVASKEAESVSVLDYIDPARHAAIAAGTDANATQEGFNAALTEHNEVFIPPGTYYLTDQVTIPLGKRLYGAGRRKTLIKVPATFNLSATGVFRFAAGDPGGELADFTIEFTQPDSAVIGDYTQYPPAVYAQGVPRFDIARLRIALAWNGIDMKGNSGGATIADLELSMFNIGIDIQGSLDTIKITNLHIWPFVGGAGSFTNNQRTAWKSGFGIKSEKCDGLKLSDSLIYEVRKGLYLYKGAGQADITMASLTNIAFDGDGAMQVVDDARVSIAASYWTKGATDGVWLTMNGGQVRITGCRLAASNATISGNGLIDISGGNLWLTGCGLERGARDHSFVYASGSATVNVAGSTLFSTAATTFTKPAVNYTGTSTGSFTGNFSPAKGGGTGAMVAIASDNGVTVGGNAADGWTVTGPATRAKTLVTGNVGAEHDFFAGCVDSAGASAGLPSGWVCARLGTGNYTITHNLGLNAVRDMIFSPVGEVSDAVASWEVTNSTTAQARIRTTVAGAAADAAFSFIARRRR